MALTATFYRPFLRAHPACSNAPFQGISLCFPRRAVLSRGLSSSRALKKETPCLHFPARRRRMRNMEVKVAPTAESDTKRTYSVGEAIETLGFGPFQSGLLVYTGLAWVGEAMEMMLLSFVGPAVQNEWALQGWQEGAIASVVFLGMLIGAYSWGVLADLKGRRFGFFATAMFTFAAGLASAMAPNYWVLLATRFLVGIGLGGGPTVFSLFLEFLPDKDRGFWLIGINLFWTLGSILEAGLAWAILPTLGWRWLLAISALPLLGLLLFYPWLPESPRFLLAVQKDQKAAIAVLQQISKANKRPLPPGDVSLSYEKQVLLPLSSGEILPQQNTPLNSSLLSSIGGVLKPLLSEQYRKSTFLLWGIFFGNAFTYYGLVLLTSQLAGGNGCHVGGADEISEATSTSSVYLDVLLTSMAELPGLLVAAGLLDRIGRKPTMKILFASCGLFLLPLLFLGNSSFQTLLLFGARGSIMGAFAALYIYAPEYYPTKIRSTGLGVGNSFARIGGFLCPLVAVDLVSNCHQVEAVALFAAVPILASIAVQFLPVETKGRGLVDRVD